MAVPAPPVAPAVPPTTSPNAIARTVMPPSAPCCSTVWSASGTVQCCCQTAVAAAASNCPRCCDNGRAWGKGGRAMAGRRNVAAMFGGDVLLAIGWRASTGGGVTLLRTARWGRGRPKWWFFRFVACGAVGRPLRLPKEERERCAPRRVAPVTVHDSLRRYPLCPYPALSRPPSLFFSAFRNQPAAAAALAGTEGGGRRYRERPPPTQRAPAVGTGKGCR